MGDTVQAIFVWNAVMLRALWAGLVLVTVAGASFIEPIPRAAIPVVVAGMAWSAYVWRLARRGGFSARRMAWTDAVIFATMLAGEASLVPAALIGDGTSWVFAGASVSVLAACMLLRPVEALWVVLLVIAGYLAGILAAGESVLFPDGPVTSSLLLVQCLVGVVVVRTLRRTATRADDALNSEVAGERAIIIEKRREQEHQTQERMLHDKVRATLWLIGDGHLKQRPAAALDSCHESLGALRDLSEGRLADALTRTAEHAVGAAVVWARSTGLDVSFTVRASDDAPAPDGTVAGDDIPTAVCEAVGDATRQALANVRAHSGTNQVHVDLVAGTGTVQVKITDRGRGFDPLGVGAIPQGIRDSIIGRMQGVGGRARVQSKPGQGTTVTLTWQAAASQVPTEPQSTSGVLRLYGASFLRLLIGAGLTYHGLSLYAAIHSANDYSDPRLALAAWAVQLVAGAVLVVGMGRYNLRPAAVWVCIAAIVAASITVALDCRPAGVLGFANWPFGEVVWTLSVAAAYVPLRRLAWAFAVHDALQTLVIAVKVRHSFPALVKLSALLLENVMLQLGLAVAVTILIRTSTVTAGAVLRTGILKARLYAQQIARRSRRIRAAEVDSEIYSLLESVTSGALDPADPATQRRFQAASSTMRREDALTELETDTASLAALAERAVSRDVHVEIEPAENFLAFPRPVRQPILAAMAAALEFASPGKALMILHNRADMTLRDWECAGQEWHRTAHSMTLAFQAPGATIAPMREDLKRLVATSRIALAFDLDIDPTDSHPTAEVFLSVTARQ